MPGSRLTAHGSQPRTRKYLFFTKSFQEKTTGIAFNFVSTSKNKDLKMIRRKKKKKVKKKKKDFEVFKLEAIKYN